MLSDGIDQTNFMYNLKNVWLQRKGRVNPYYVTVFESRMTAIMRIFSQPNNKSLREDKTSEFHNITYIF